MQTDRVSARSSKVGNNSQTDKYGSGQMGRRMRFGAGGWWPKNRPAPERDVGGGPW